MKIIDKKAVQHVAFLSRLALDDSESEEYCAQLESILSYIEKLNEIDTKNVQPTTHALSSLKNVFRKDTLGPSLDVEAVLKNAPSREGVFFKVPQVIESLGKASGSDLKMHRRVEGE